MHTLVKKAAVGVVTFGALATGGVSIADKAIDPYTETATTFELPIKADIPQGERVEIAKDKAAMTMKGWNGEYAITIEPQDPNAKGTDKSFKTVGNRPLLSKAMQFKSGNIVSFIQPVSSTTNQFDIDFTLDSKPTTNIFDYKITGADDFNFYYQPPLNEEMSSSTCTETDCGGSHRDENVVGSYAVYSKDKANHEVGQTNYATGKIAQIDRPKVTDANGNWVWASLQYATGTLSVNVPQSFLDKATYPVTVDPTFGYTSQGGGISVYTSFEATLFTAPDTGTVTSMSSYVSVTSGSTDYNIGYFNNNSGSVGTQVAHGTTQTVGISGLITTSVSGSITSGNGYWLVLENAHHDGNSGIYFDTSSPFVVGSGGRITPYTYDTWPDNPGALTTDGRKRSIYATYTAAIPPAAATHPQSEFFFDI